MKTCKHCGGEIPQERVEFLEQSNRDLTCVKHSKEQAAKSYLVFDNKTAGSIMIVPNRSDGSHDIEAIRQAERADKRDR